MDLGVAIPPAPGSWKTVRRAEELGFSHAWFYDSQLLYTDVFVAMTAAALRTRRIRLGTGVLIPSNRLAPVAANALASLAALAPGRIDCGVGTGFTGRRTMGLEALPLRALRESVRVMRALWKGETLEWEIEGQHRRLRFLNPEVAALCPSDPIPVHVSAFGPRARRYAAEAGDGWMTFFVGDEAALEGRSAVAQACRELGREPASLYSTAFALGCVLAPGEAADGPRARAQAGPLVAAVLHSFVEAEERGSLVELPEALRPVVQAYAEIYRRYEPADARYLTLHRGHLVFLRPEEEPLIGAELIRAMTLTGTAEELLARLRALRDAGYQQLAIQVVPGHEDALEDWARLFEKL